MMIKIMMILMMIWNSSSEKYQIASRWGRSIVVGCPFPTDRGLGKMKTTSKNSKRKPARRISRCTAHYISAN